MGFPNPEITTERLEAGAVVFSEAVLDIIKSKAVKSAYSADFLIDHVIIVILFAKLCCFH